MKTLCILMTLITVSSFAQTTKEEKKKDPYHKDNMDYGDKQLLRRDVCRKPMEALESKYDNIRKEDLNKMKEDCSK